ncbi:hypothetical protein SAY87_025478 [Trapa incisa]|uniref:Uncharacterized protein n=1 Tax=Trapa incisa TaxID=236973 RepID=A0AAN7GAX4_9MYRT|nr:hypothetical protein SAY87_025478 [Trapa incisa]
MEVEKGSALSPAYCTQEKCVEELRQCLLWTSLELENTKAVAQQEMRVRDEQVAQLRGLLERTIQERDEAREKLKLLENLFLQQQMAATAAAAAPVSGGSTVEDEFNGGFSVPDCDDSIVSSPKATDPVQPPPSSARSLDSFLSLEKPLPEKGKLLQAVMGTGPLLQTLLLAGPLPQWQHPPPPLESSEIPPVKIPSPPLPPPPPSAPLFLQDSITSCASVSNKRGHPGRLFDIFPAETKYQRVALL